MATWQPMMYIVSLSELISKYYRTIQTVNLLLNPVSMIYETFVSFNQFQTFFKSVQDQCKSDLRQHQWWRIKRVHLEIWINALTESELFLYTTRMNEWALYTTHSAASVMGYPGVNQPAAMTRQLSFWPRLASIVYRIREF